MDDVWGNAWAQPEEDVAHSVPTKSKLNDVPSWSFSSAATGKEEEADVGLPSWSTGELNWTEPTGQASLWSTASATNDLALGADGWGTSTDLNPSTQFQAIGVTEQTANDSLPLHDPENNETHNNAHQSEEGPSRALTPDSAGTVTSVINEHVDPSGVKPESASPPPVLSSGFEVVSDTDAQDTFSSFESGGLSVSDSTDENIITWASPVATFDDGNEEDAWGSAWKAPDSVMTDDEGQKDEWTIAREQKARKDRTVPPELLAAILDRLSSLSAELWMDKDKPSFDQDMRNWRDGMANITGLEETMERVLPEIPGQPPIHFSKSHIAKAMGKSVKLSKNLPIVRNSPMSHLFTAKSLAAWELAVKSRTDLPKDDIPVGWRTVELEKTEEPKTAPKERRASGFLSFFSKRASAVPSPGLPESDTDSKRSSLSREVSSDTVSPSAATRNSIDANSLSSKMQQSSSVSSLASALAVGSPTTTTLSTGPTPSSPAPASAGPVQPSHSEPASQPAPSAVSRFFNRFSSSRSDTRSSSSSPRNSMALSTDDLEFLSDIVPSHSDDTDEDQQLQSLTALVNSPALPTKLPPPLAPPPLAPPPRSSSVSRSHTLQPHVQSQVHIRTSSSSSGAKSVDPLDDLRSLTATPPDKQFHVAPTSSRTSAATVPLALPIPLSPTSVASLSKPPTPSPLSGGATRATHSRTSTSSSIRSLTDPAISSRVVSPRPAEPIPSSSSPVNSGMTSAGSVSVMTAVSNSSIQNQLQTNFSPLSPIPPPPIEKSPDRDLLRPGANLLDDIDDFSDFQSYESSAVALSQSSHAMGSAVFDSSFDVPHGMASASSPGPPQEDLFGDFGSFLPESSISAQVSTLRSPPTSPTSPPVGSAGVPPPLPRKQPPANINMLHLRKPSATDHDATSRLLQRAAARPGRWPAPPSPIPNPLPPPPSSSANSRTSTSNKSLLELDSDGVVQAPAMPVRSIPLKPIAEIAPSTLTPSKAASPPPLLPPPGSGSKVALAAEAPLLDFGDITQPMQPPVIKPHPPASSARSTKSGLSAQDLSFFDSI